MTEMINVMNPSSKSV